MVEECSAIKWQGSIAQMRSGREKWAREIQTPKSYPYELLVLATLHLLITHP